MNPLTFALIREGTSDDGLVAHIRTLLLACGASSVLGAPREYKGTTEERIAHVLEEESIVDLIFVHRDADSRDPSTRRTEISAAAVKLNHASKVVPIVPVQELEAWLLADEAAIRQVAGRPNSRVDLKLPSVTKIESTNSPKEVLKAACVAATESTGARRQRHTRNFPRMRSTLLERLEHDGPVQQLPSWQAFVHDVTAKAAEIAANTEAEVEVETGSSSSA